MMNQDSDLPGALVLIYTLRKYSTQDRDMLVFVSANVRPATRSPPNNKSHILASTHKHSHRRIAAVWP